MLTARARLGSLAILATAVVSAALLPASEAQAATLVSGCTVVDHPGFTSSYWTPYDDFPSGQLVSALTSQSAIGEKTIITDWAADQDTGAHDVAYAGSTLAGYGQFNSSVDNLMAAASSVTGFKVWAGLVVGPSSFDASIATPAGRASEIALFEQVATDLYGKFGNAVTGWFIPTEPGWTQLADPASAANYLAFLSPLTTWLHTHVGHKPVMIAATVQSAATYGHTASDFVNALAANGVFSTSGIDVWNLEDGYGQTAWTPQSEETAYLAAKADVAAVTTPNAPAGYLTPVIWGTIWTPQFNQATPPVAQPPAAFEPYLVALGASSTGAGVPLSEWEFPTYMNPDTTAPNSSPANYADYRRYCRGT